VAHQNKVRIWSEFLVTTFLGLDPAVRGAGPKDILELPDSLLGSSTATISKKSSVSLGAAALSPKSGTVDKYSPGVSLLIQPS